MEKQIHTINALLYAISNGMERASYYGIRSILILYMISESLDMSQKEALAFYGWLTMSIYVSKVVGALLGDLLIGNKISILIGGVLQTLGCFLLCYPSIIFLYIGVGLIVLGNGLFSPNVLSQFGKQYSNKPKIIDAGFSGLFFFINLGAFLGVMLIGLIGNENFSYGFIFGGLLMLLATLLGFFNKDQTSEIKEPSFKNNPVFSILLVFMAIVLSGVFWACYEMSGGLTALYVSKSDLDYSNWINISSASTVLFTLLFAFIWTFVYLNQFAKFCFGLLISALAFTFLMSFSKNPEQESSMVLILASLLLSLGESFISPMIYAITTKYSKTKYLAILFSLVTLPLMIFSKISGMIAEKTSEFNETNIFITLIIILIVFGIFSAIMWFVQKGIDKNRILKNNIELNG